MLEFLIWHFCWTPTNAPLISSVKILPIALTGGAIAVQAARLLWKREWAPVRSGRQPWWHPLLASYGNGSEHLFALEGNPDDIHCSPLMETGVSTCSLWKATLMTSTARLLWKREWAPVRSGRQPWWHPLLASYGNGSEHLFALEGNPDDVHCTGHTPNMSLQPPPPQVKVHS